MSLHMHAAVDDRGALAAAPGGCEGGVTCQGAVQYRSSWVLVSSAATVVEA